MTNSKKSTQGHITNFQIEDKEKNLESNQGEITYYLGGKTISMMVNFSSGIIETRVRNTFQPKNSIYITNIF